MRGAADVVQPRHFSPVPAASGVLYERMRLRAHAVEPGLVRDSLQGLLNRAVPLAGEILTQFRVQLSHLGLGASPCPADLPGIVMAAQLVVHPDRTIVDINPGLSLDPIADGREQNPG